MCEFCENIAKDDEAFVKMRRKQQKEFIFISNNKFHVFVDTGDSFCPGILNDTKFCPKCGRDLRQQIDETLMPPSNVFEELQQYCEKYGVKVEDRALNFDFVLELLGEVERKCLKEQ